MEWGRNPCTHHRHFSPFSLLVFFLLISAVSVTSHHDPQSRVVGLTELILQHKVSDVREDGEGGSIGESYERVPAFSDKLLLLLFLLWFLGRRCVSHLTGNTQQQDNRLIHAFRPRQCWRYMRPQNTVQVQCSVPCLLSFHLSCLFWTFSLVVPWFQVCIYWLYVCIQADECLS